MQKGLVSVIIPVYNHTRAIGPSLHSLQKQTYRQIEVIIVDDGSTDNLEKTLNKILPNYDFPVEVIKQKNKGAPAARNTAIKRAQGEFYLFWDADTVGKPEMVEELVGALNDHPEVAYAYSQFRFGWKKFHSWPFDAERLKKMNYIDVTSLVRSEAMNGLGWDESFIKFQDWDLWLTLLEHGKTGIFVPRLLYRKITGWRKGYSSWLPALAYRLPFKTKGVREYDKWKEIIKKKHGLI